MLTDIELARAERARAPFARALVGIDSSPESVEAARQAAVLAEGPLSLLAAWDLTAALYGGAGLGAPVYLDRRSVEQATTDSLAAVQKELAGVASTTETARGPAWSALLEAIERRAASLVAVGSHGNGRARGIIVGSTATELIHKAPCSVLVARSTDRPFPSRIVVGLDGSEESLAAYDVAEQLAERFDAKLKPLVAYLENDPDPEEVQKLVERRVRRVFNYAVNALTDASADADLVVVGSRGLRGIKALGSVAERVAHRADSSVLIVRGRS